MTGDDAGDDDTAASLAASQWPSEEHLGTGRTPVDRDRHRDQAVSTAAGTHKHKAATVPCKLRAVCPQGGISMRVAGSTAW